jgi:hypothetical protein
VAKKKGSSKNRKMKYEQYKAQNRRDVNKLRRVRKHWYNRVKSDISRILSDDRSVAFGVAKQLVNEAIPHHKKVLTRDQKASIVSQCTN